MTVASGRVAHAVGEVIARLGGHHVFGVIGSGNLVVANALRAAGADFVAARHECGALTMADAYARVSGRIGVCTVHQGPGLTNAVTGLAEAAKSRTPLVVLAADTAGSAVRSNFRIDQAGLVNAVGAVAERLHGPETAVADTVRAYRRAEVERRPVVLMMPLDLQNAPHPPPDLAALTVTPGPASPRPGFAGVSALADLLADARRPAILAGRGAVLAHAREPLERLADRVGALLTTSACANGLFAGNPWSLGISGGFASPCAARLLAESDAILAFGASLNMWTTRHGRLVGPGTVVGQVDVDAEAIGAHRRVDVGVLGDATETARDLLAELERRGHRSTGWREPAVRDQIAHGHWRDEPYDDAGRPDRIDPRTLSVALDDVLPADRTIAVDSGHFMGWPPMYVGVPDPQAFVFTQAFQSIGLGLATAIGAAVARPDRLTVAALGDGGALMALAELETVARLAPRMLVVIYNDAAYGAEVLHFRPAGEQVDLVRFPDTDFAALGRAAGIGGLTVRARPDLDAVGEWLERGASAPLLVDAKVDPDVCADWLEEAFRGH